MHIPARSKLQISHRRLNPLPFPEKFKITFQHGKRLVFPRVLMRRWPSAGRARLNDNESGPVRHRPIDENVDLLAEDLQGLDRRHKSSAPSSLSARTSL